MELNPACRRQPVVERVTNEDVREPQPTRDPGDARHHASDHCLIEDVEQIVLRESAEVRERVDRELASQHRGEQQQVVALAREMGQTAGDHVPNALRDRQMNFASGMQPDPLERQEPHGLGDEQRVALGLRIQIQCQLLRGAIS